MTLIELESLTIRASKCHVVSAFAFDSRIKSCELMKTKILFCLLITISVFSASAQSGAEWNAYKRANGIDPRWTYNAWVAAGMPRGGGGNNGGGYSGPSAEQIAEQQREQAAQQQDKQGLKAFNLGDYETAISDFQKALQNLPNDSAIQKHLADAQQAQTDEKNFQTKKAAHDAAHDADQGGLARPVGSEQGEDLALLNSQIHFGEGGKPGRIDL